MKFVIFCIAWLFSGCLLLIFRFPVFARRHVLFLLVLVPLVFLYLNDVREPHRVEFGDFPAYYFAAVDISNNQPINQQPDRLYRYPPLFATMLTPLASLGLHRASEIFRLVNLAALVLLSCLLYQVLQRYAFSRELAAVTVFLVLCINVPVARTLIYQQVNILVVDLMLLSLLLYPRYLFFSALALGTAIHIKIYPLLLALPFFWARDWRWCAWFLLSMAGIVLATSMANSFDYYVDFVRVMMNWTLEGEASVFRETGIRNVSVGTLVYNTLHFSGLDLWQYEKTIANVLRLLLLALFARGAWLTSRAGGFRAADSTNPVVSGGYVVLPLFMLIVSPSIWPHHFVFLILTMPVLLSVLRESRQLWLFLVAYILVFHFPVNEIYPVSYLRLLGLVMIGLLLNYPSKGTTGTEPGWFRLLKARLELPGTRLSG